MLSGKFTFKCNKNKLIIFTENIWGQRSQSCKDLIKKMLTIDPKERISCVDALQHPWIRQKVHIELSPLHMNEAMSNLQQFTVITRILTFRRKPISKRPQ